MIVNVEKMGGSNRVKNVLKVRLGKVGFAYLAFNISPGHQWFIARALVTTGATDAAAPVNLG